MIENKMDQWYLGIFEIRSCGERSKLFLPEGFTGTHSNYFIDIEITKDF